MYLSEFLLARVAEDEAAAQEHMPDIYQSADWDVPSIWPSDEYHHVCVTPTRVLAECASKRRLIDWAYENARLIDGEWDCCHSDEAIRAGECKNSPGGVVEVVQELAQAYSDHPDFDPAWRIS